MLARALTYGVYGGEATRFITIESERPTLIAVLGVLAFMAIVALRFFPRIGLVASGSFLWLCALSALLAGTAFY